MRSVSAVVPWPLMSAEMRAEIMGFQPPPPPTVTREQAVARWCEEEASREFEAFLQGQRYTYHSFPDQHFVPGRGLLIPPSGATFAAPRKKQS